MNGSKISRKAYELQCISPVHIGNGDKLKAFEYLYDRKMQEVYFLNESKWITFLHHHHLIDDFAAYVQNVTKAIQQKEPFRGKNVWEWLQSKNIADSEIRSLGIRCARAAVNTLEDSRKGTLNDIDCQMALSDGRPYIPGSSIKGAFRTGMLCSMIKKNPEKYRLYWEELIKWRKSNLYDKRKTWSAIVQRMESEFLAKLTIPSEKRLTNEVKSVMRGLLVSDAVCIAPEVETIILQKLDNTTKENRFGRTEKRLPLFRECIPTGTKLRFSVTMDFSMLNEIGIYSMDEIIQMSRDFIQDGLNRQREVFGKSYPTEFAEADTADIFLGGGTGFLTKSLMYILAPTHEDAKQLTAEYLDQAFTVRQKGSIKPAHWHVKCDTKIAPRTLKLTRTRTDRSIMGLCSIREIDGC